MIFIQKLNTTATITLLIVSCSTWASTCKVIDPELQDNYVGPCNSQGLANGTGTANGIAFYEGEFRNGKKHGIGKKQWPITGDIYIGEFHNDYRHGQGNYTWGERSSYAGQQYTGNFIQDSFEGIGTYNWPNGDKFTGIWKQNIRYGMTYMEIRQKEIRELHIAAFQRLGQTVCRNAQYGISGTILLKGTVTNIEDPAITIDLIEESASYGLYLTKKINIEKEIELWSPCIIS
ncbi:hypothetical protein [Chitinimonas sp. BJB300]|uniref:hypothetical protein n=1 Tax=Chitinimonas sp. BJB300 TaxID=1559339 RepID=UPI000C0FFA70|nr:hypothetical protein [Chitinimonas sp. BJB300]PHV11159.1 hypothetical protein CSQ89_12430 [Chitinimonas sp. BJB300]TSJ85556.1 hypothetical protein FG002_017340 [Chitinimonas sp. BJB300]